MKSLLFLAASALSLTVAGCSPSTPPVARAALDCPATQGDLDRTSVSPDKRTCLYTTRGGDEVSLRLISAPGGYQAALAPIELELGAEVIPEKDAAAAKIAETKADAEQAKDSPDDVKAAANDAAKAAREAAEDALGDIKGARKDDEHDAALGVNTDSRGEHAHIDLPGIHINADDNGKANVNVGMIHVDAGENGAVVRIDRDVRLRGEALSRERRGFRATYILAQDNLKDGWKAVGYEAGGPKTGPVTVAVVKAKTGNRHDVFDDVKRLVRKNGGV